MAITFNDKLIYAYTIRHYVSDGGAMVLRSYGYSAADLFDDGDVAGAFLTFSAPRGDSSKFNGISFDISTALVADSISIAWEYCRRGSDAYSETWHALSNVVDGTNGFTQSGEITWDVPEDWENYLRVQGNGDWYRWVVRARIDSVTNM
ncbi:MAG TPA: hypothetical protein ENL06_01510, partial [Candidatus Portnoybacteria bacterium]|nr:hypothetical protein [Candidatus Portnoybacteria bacterium]